MSRMQNAECKMQSANGKSEPLRARTKSFALRIIRMHVTLSMRRDETLRVLTRQCLRSGTSVGAQYREACRARSTAEFLSKIECALQELDETTYWLELIAESGLAPAEQLSALHDEARQLTAIFVASINTAKRQPRKVRNAKV